MNCEDQLSRLFGYEHVVLFGRARSGLVAVLEEVGGPDCPVIVPSNICVAVLAAVVAAGASPLVCAVSPTSGLADDERLAAAISSCRSGRGVVMPTHLYGQLATYERTRRVAAERGWFVLENDSQAATIGLGRQSRSPGGALLLSFGGGKTIDAGGGGAILTDDRDLALALSRRAQHWPPVTDRDEAAETNLVLARRYLQALHRPGASECLLDIDIANCRSGFDPSVTSSISAALARFTAENGFRQDRLERWKAALAGLAPEIEIASVPARTPWRAVFRFRTPLLRDAAVEALRHNRLDAGTNYPPVTDFFPDLLRGQKHEDAELWGRTVITLWLTAAYSDDKIDEAAGLIRKTIDDHRDHPGEARPA